MVEAEPAQQLGFREHIVGGLTAMTRALVMVAILHYLWLSFGNSLYARMVKNTYGQPEVFRGITSLEDGSALTIGPTARPRTGRSNDSVYMLVDSGASGHYFDDAIIPAIRDRLEEYKVLDVPRKIATAGGGESNGTAQGALRGHVIGDKGVRRLIQLSCLIVPGLGRNLFSVKQAARNGVVSILDMTNRKLGTHKHTFPLQDLG